MTKAVTVTRAQKSAAQWMVQRYVETGRDVPDETRRIAEATPAPPGDSLPDAAGPTAAPRATVFIPAPARSVTSAP